MLSGMGKSVPEFSSPLWGKELESPKLIECVILNIAGLDFQQ